VTGPPCPVISAAAGSAPAPLSAATWAMATTRPLLCEQTREGPAGPQCTTGYDSDVADQTEVHCGSP